MSEPVRPVPEPTPLTAPFWDATARRELLIQRCEACGQHQFYPRYCCMACGRRGLAWVQAAGGGTVHSFTIARRPTLPSLTNLVPYVIALVDLDEGPRLTTNLVDCDVQAVDIGMRVELTFEALTPELALPTFRPAALGASATAA